MARYVVDPELEQAVLGEVSLDAPWEIVEKFNGIVRDSGGQGERDAVKILTGKLDRWGVKYNLYTPTLLVSLPKKASVKVLECGCGCRCGCTEAQGTAGGEFRVLKAKTPAMSASTAPGSLELDLVYIGAGYAKTANDVFAGLEIDDVNSVRGKAVMTEGLPLPGRVTDLMAAGAAAVVFISPGERIHEGICTSIWGSPDLDSIGRKPYIPVVSISRSDGLWLKGLLEKGPVKVDISTELDEGWRPVSVLVAEIEGSEDPDKFVLVHGHLDSWHVGISDNATGNATLLELARVLSKFQGNLKRSVRIAWWSGHSHGRYAGSTWYSDNFALDLLENCVAHINCDSTGCKDATVYEGVSMTKEFEPFCYEAIKDACGCESTGDRVPRAGDCSFANLGIGTYYMLLPSIPEDVRKAKGLYHVGGSGGNNEWHHEDDTIEVADRDNLLRDTRIYALSVLRSANMPVLPYDLVSAAREVKETIKGYGALIAKASDNAGQGHSDASHGDLAQAEGVCFDTKPAGASVSSCPIRLDFAPAISEAEALVKACERLAARQAGLQAEGRGINDPDVKAINETLLAVERVLVRVNYVRGDIFKQDPALEWPPVPDLAASRELARVEMGSDRYYLLLMHLRRGLNRVVWHLKQARKFAGVVEGR
jgi:N-acetylated-alpha-linked acidic dipeptidase